MEPFETPTETEAAVHTFTLEERVAILRKVMPMFHESFETRAQERQRLLDSRGMDDSPNEEVWFDNVTLELNPAPSLYLVDYNLQPITGPRLELHLRGGLGVQQARVQMGRMARYIDTRNLADEFPDISAITYTRLAVAAEAITHMKTALYVHTPAHISQDAYNRVDGAYFSYNRFLKKNGRKKIKPKQFTLRAQTLPTSEFAEHWRDYVV